MFVFDLTLNVSNQQKIMNISYRVQSTDFSSYFRKKENTVGLGNTSPDHITTSPSPVYTKLAGLARIFQNVRQKGQTSKSKSRIKFKCSVKSFTFVRHFLQEMSSKKSKCLAKHDRSVNTRSPVRLQKFSCTLSSLANPLSNLFRLDSERFLCSPLKKEIYVQILNLKPYYKFRKEAKKFLLKDSPNFSF